MMQSGKNDWSVVVGRAFDIASARRVRVGLAAKAILGVMLLAACERGAVDPAQESSEPVASIEVTPRADTLEVGGPRSSVQLVAVLKDAQGRVLTGREIRWESSDWTVIVSSDGVAAAHPALPDLGTARVTATSEGVSARVELVLVPRIARFSIVDPPSELRVGQSLVLTARSESDSGAHVNTPPAVYASSDSTVLRVDARGKLWARGEGTATIIAAAMGRTAEFEVRVLPVDLPYYRVTWLGTLGGDDALAYDVNDAGQVVGHARTPSGEWHAFLWEDGAMRDLGRAGETSVARAINNAGVAVGASGRHTPTERPRARVWGQGWPAELGLDFTAVDINDRGQIVVAGPAMSTLWENGALTRLRIGEAEGMNGKGWVVAGEYSGMPSWRLEIDGAARAFRVGGRYVAMASAISDAGRVVGYFDDFGGDFISFLWQEGYRFISAPPGERGARARDLNEQAVVVGTLGTGDGDGGFVWKDGSIVSLDERLAEPGWEILDARAINESGQIAGVARSLATGARGAVLLTPR